MEKYYVVRAKTSYGFVEHTAATLEMAIHIADPRRVTDIREAFWTTPQSSLLHPVENIDLLRELCNHFSVWPNPPLPRY